MSIPKNSLYYFFFQPNPPKLFHFHTNLYTIYYTIHNNQYIPIIFSKPHSTHPPHYFTTSPPLLQFPTLQQLQNHFSNKSNYPFK